jgi:hypothetical protein
MSKDATNFDHEYWQSIISKSTWYFDYAEFLKSAKNSLGEESEEFAKLRRKIREFFEQQLLANKVNLAKSGPDLDSGREPIDTIVIHHTSGKPGYRLSYMNAVQLTNIYAPYFANPTDKRERSLMGQPIWSGHFLEGKPSFIGYHWLMRMEGKFERLLKDDQIGWHAGNWNINKRSVGICLDNDYEDQDPSSEILQKLAVHIKNNYGFVKSDNIIGHREARKGTICPGTNFLSGWKKELLKYLGEPQ